MQSHALSCRIPLEDLVEQILSSQALTKAEENFLASVLSSQRSLTDEQKAIIERVFYGLRHGLLKVVD